MMTLSSKVEEVMDQIKSWPIVRTHCIVLAAIFACVAVADCGDSVALRKAEAAQRAAEERAIAAEKSLAESAISYWS